MVPTKSDHNKQLRNRERDGERQIDGHKYKKTEIRERQTNTGRQRYRERERETDRRTHTQKDRDIFLKLRQKSQKEFFFLKNYFCLRCCKLYYCEVSDSLTPQTM
jgi:hypothetical protein